LTEKTVNIAGNNVKIWGGSLSANDLANTLSSANTFVIPSKAELQDAPWCLCAYLDTARSTPPNTSLKVYIPGKFDGILNISS
jgi:hypothetical protein